MDDISIFFSLYQHNNQREKDHTRTVYVELEFSTSSYEPCRHSCRSKNIGVYVRKTNHYVRRPDRKGT